jgi:sigma-B regulation protein RsbU (phosphoserine phosphatase)
MDQEEVARVVAKYDLVAVPVVDARHHLVGTISADDVVDIVGEEANKLHYGGTVVGLFDDCLYEEGTIQAEPGSLLVAYSDGLIEPENVYGEEFGTRRLLEVTLRHRGEAPRAVANALMVAAEEWAGSAEQADDMTVIVARIE